MSNILLIGYGKMGKTIEKIAISKEHTIVGKINSQNNSDLANFTSEQVDVAIEFSNPESAYQNIKICIEKNIPVVSGTTGWLAHQKEIEQLCKEKKSAFFYASNFSIGVNIFFKINKELARLMNNQKYNIQIAEIHHTQKLDAPSGTAITLAEGILGNVKQKSAWHLKNGNAEIENSIEIAAFREPKVPGTHQITYSSVVDTIEIKHTAHSREGFATGAVLSAIWLIGKTGIFGMEDFLK